MKCFFLAMIFPAVIFFSSCTGVPMSVFPGSSSIPADFAGIAHAGHTRTQTELNHLDYLGVRWVLRTYNWHIIEPYQGEWDFLEYDAHADTTTAAGIKIIGILAYENWWINEDRTTPRRITAEQLPYFLDYVRKTVEHFQGRVDAWRIWNEPNSRRFWAGTDEEFYELTRQTAEAIREIDSEVVILGGGFNRNVMGLREDFIRGLFESGAMEKVDAVAFHPYEINPVRSAILYNQFKEIVADYGFEDKIWVTEVGYPTGGRYPTQIRENRLPEYVVKTWVFLAASGTKNIIWYQLFDPPDRVNKNSEHFFGLTRSRRDFTSKGAEAFRLCSLYLSDSICYPIDPEQEGLPKSVKSFWFKKEDGGALVLWNDGLGSSQVHLRLPGTDHFLYDLVSGNSNSIPAELTVRAGREPVFITWQGHGALNDEGPVISK